MKLLKRMFIALLMAPATASAQGVFKAGDELLLQTSLWTTHYSSNPEHNEHQKMINLEWYLPTYMEPEWLQAEDPDSWRNDVRWMVGAANFRNSFSQRSTYIYAGGRYHFPLTENTRSYVKVTAGLLHGYRGRYRDKIPLNNLGVAPVILPAVGLEVRDVNVELVPFGASGLMANIGYYFR